MPSPPTNNTIPNDWPHLLLPRPTTITPVNTPTCQWPTHAHDDAPGIVGCLVNNHTSIVPPLLKSALDSINAKPTDDPRAATISIQITNPTTTTLTPPADQQKYSLTINPTATPPIQIHAPTPIAARYALTTLAQLLAITNGLSLPACRITDAPAIPIRGLMLDVSRDRVPTMDFAADLISALADLKINHLQFYMEHTFAYTGHEAIWQYASPFTPSEIRSLDTFAADHGIELAANQNCFGHLTRFLSHPDYAHLAETHGDWLFDNGSVRVPRTGPFSLCPTDPASLTFITGLLEQLIPCCNSPRINIACDETFDIGTGRSKTQVAARSRAAVALDFIRQITDVVRRIKRESQNNDAIPMIWADLLLTDDREAAKDFPQDIPALLWGYEADTPFEQNAKRLADDSNNSRPVWFCPGTSAWRSITGRSSTRNANIASAVNAAIKHGAQGLLMTEWGDHGHRQTWPIALHAIAHAAACAWNPLCMTDPDHRAATINYMSDPTGALGPFLETLGDLDRTLRDAHHLFNSSALYAELHHPLTVKPHLGSLNDWHQQRDQLAALAQSQPRSRSSLINDELTHTIAVAQFAIDRALWRREPQSISRRNLIESINTIIADHRALWLRRSRPGGLDDSARYYETLRDELTAQ